MEERCVVCGEIIPEGRLVCPMCEKAEDKDKVYNNLVKVWQYLNDHEMKTYCDYVLAALEVIKKEKQK